MNLPLGVRTRAFDGPAPEAAHAGLRAQAQRSALWALLQSGGKQACDLLVFLLLAKWLTPADFGAVALASATVMLLGVVVEMGLGEALLRHPQLQEEHLNSAFWLGAACGALAAGALIAVAPLLAHWVGQPQLAPLLMGLASVVVLNSLNTVPMALLQRNFGFRKLAMRTLTASVVAGLCSLYAASLGFGPWSLVIQQVSSATLGAVVLWWQTPWRPQWQFARRSAKELLNFGRHTVGTRLLNVGASKADELAVGLVLGPSALGYYSVACRMLLALEQLMSQGVDAVALAAFSRARHCKLELREMFLHASQMAAAVSLPLFAAAFFLAPEIILFCVGAKWQASVPILQVLLVAGAVHSLMHLNHAVFKACDRPTLSLELAAASALLNIVTLLVSIRFGPMAVAASYVARSALIAPLGLLQVGLLLQMEQRHYWRAISGPVMATGIGIASALGVRQLQDSLNSHLHPVVSTLAFVLVYGAALHLVWRAQAPKAGV